MADILKVEIRGLTGVLDALKSLPPEIVSKRGGPVRASLRAAGKPLLDEAKRNVQRIINTPNKDGRFVSTGLALSSLIIKRGRVRGQNGEAVYVTVRRGQNYGDKMLKRKGRRTESLRANDVLYMLEHGTETRPPMPWSRPAFDAKKQAALDTFNAEMKKRTTAAIKKAEKLAAAKANQP